MMKPKSHKNPSGTRFLEESDTYNLTHLSPMKEWARNRTIHRDFNAHCFRWQHAAMMMYKNPLREDAAVLDIACGPDWPQLITMHSNGCMPKHYMGVDLRDCSTTMPKASNANIIFQQCDITQQLPPNMPILDKLSNAEDGTERYNSHTRPWDMIVCFEVLEHMPKANGLKLLDNIQAIMGQETLVLFSTPVFDQDVGMAENHLYEWKYEELKEELLKRFTLENHFGTFASLRDYMPLMDAAELKLLAKLKQYYNSALISCMMAPLYPEKARNVLWHLKRKS